MESHDERIGRLIQRYATNKALVAGLRDSVKCTGDALKLLGLELSETRPERLSLSETDTVGFGYSGGKVSPRTISDLCENIAALKESLKDKAHMESCLKEAGLGDLISYS